MLLRARAALFALLAAFLIPITVSSLRGLTHVLTCEEDVRTPFSLVLRERGEPLLATSTRIGRNEDPRLCGALVLDMRAKAVASQIVQLRLFVTNDSQFAWQGTIELVAGDLSIPVAIGEIPPGATARDAVRLELEPGTHEVAGSLLIGP